MTAPTSRANILLVAGGTGGHISPGLALAESFGRAGARPVFLSLGRNRTYPDFASPDFPLYFYDAPPIRKSALDLALFVPRIAAAFLRAWRLIGREGIEAVIGLGGYPMAPAVLAALARGRPVYLCEQNAVPGKVTRLLAGRARRIFLAIPLAPGSAVAPARLMLTGNPLRRRIAESIAGKAAPPQKKSKAGAADETPASELFDTLARRSGRKQALRVLVVGGSQGAVQLNRMVRAALDRMDDVLWVLQCGVNNIAALRAELSPDSYPALHLLDFTRDIHGLYRSADVLVCRAGAGVLTEAAGFGLPLVLVPYPFAADNHQRANAEVFAEAGAALLIDRRDEDPAEMIARLEELRDSKRRQAMSAAARSLARLSAADDIVATVLGDLNGAPQAGAPQAGGAAGESS